MLTIFKYWPDTLSHDKCNPEENLPLELKSGEFAGYTLLHHACIYNCPSTVMMLKTYYDLNPTAKADNGVQPIELAAFKGNFEIVDELLKLGCSINAELSHDQYVQHKKKCKRKYQKWNSTFTDKIPLFFYLLYNTSYHIGDYLKYKPNLTLLDSKNKTLLMRAIENSDISLIEFLLKHLEVKELNRQDVNGFAAVHYLFKYLFRRSFSVGSSKSQRLKILELLYRRGANLSAMGYNGPESLPIHMAAFHGYVDMLEFLLKKQTYFSLKARPLFYMIKNSDNFNSELKQTSNNVPKMKLINLIIEDIYVKHLFGYPVHTEEVKLMKQLVEKSNIIKSSVSHYEKKYEKIIPTMKSHQTLFDSSKMSIYDVVTASHKKYKKVAKNDNFHPVCMIFPASRDLDTIYDIISERLQATKRRIVIREQWEKLAFKLITSWLLPYDCILQIFKNLTNDEWEYFNEMYADENDDC